MTQPKVGREAFLAFDPNRPEHKPWATYAENRSSSLKFRMHGKRSSALQVFAQYRDLAALYQWDDTKPGWVLFARKDKESKNCRCDHCGQSTVESKQNFRHYWYGRRLDEAVWGKDMFDTGQFVWERKGSGRSSYKPGKLIEPLRMLYVCTACQQFMR